MENFIRPRVNFCLLKTSSTDGMPVVFVPIESLVAAQSITRFRGILPKLLSLEWTRSVNSLDARLQASGVPDFISGFRAIRLILSSKSEKFISNVLPVWLAFSTSFWSSILVRFLVIRFSAAEVKAIPVARMKAPKKVNNKTKRFLIWVVGMANEVNEMDLY